eukprot:scaffold118147_cov16-Tisochrysis_lutea.AAC.2
MPGAFGLACLASRCASARVCSMLCVLCVTFQGMPSGCEGSGAGCACLVAAELMVMKLLCASGEERGGDVRQGDSLLPQLVSPLKLEAVRSPLVRAGVVWGSGVVPPRSW